MTLFYTYSLVLVLYQLVPFINQNKIFQVPALWIQPDKLKIKKFFLLLACIPTVTTDSKDSGIITWLPVLWETEYNITCSSLPFKNFSVLAGIKNCQLTQQTCLTSHTNKCFTFSLGIFFLSEISSWQHLIQW